MAATGAGTLVMRMGDATAERRTGWFGALGGNRAVSLLLAAALGAWLGVVALARSMGGGVAGMPGTMGLRFVAFAGAWTLMMAAMMLPSVAPFASFYARTFTRRRVLRSGAFGAGYLLVWGAAAVPVFALAAAGDHLSVAHRTAAVALAAFLFAACGLYQLTTWKDRCLAHCRSPLGFTVRHTAGRGPLRDLRAGVHHGAFCLACCWSLMALLIAFGVMNVLAMIVLAAVVAIEKGWRRGAGFARVVGVAALVLAVVVAVHPAIAPGLHHRPMMSTEVRM